MWASEMRRRESVCLNVLCWRRRTDGNTCVQTSRLWQRRRSFEENCASLPRGKDQHPQPAKSHPIYQLPPSSRTDARTTVKAESNCFGSAVRAVRVPAAAEMYRATDQKNHPKRAHPRSQKSRTFSIISHRGKKIVKVGDFASPGGSVMPGTQWT